MSYMKVNFESAIESYETVWIYEGSCTNEECRFSL